MELLKEYRSAAVDAVITMMSKQDWFLQKDFEALLYSKLDSGTISFKALDEYMKMLFGELPEGEKHIWVEAAEDEERRRAEAIKHAEEIKLKQRETMYETRKKELGL
jgi:hypothetical protein